MPESLDDLLQSARAGSRRDFEAFVEATRPELASFCARLAGASEGDDAVQETYVAAWRALPSFRGEASARTWLYAIAKRIATRTRTRRQRWGELSAAGRPTAVAAPSLRPEIEAALSSLDPERRAALLLTQVFGFSYAEAAVICDCPIGTIRSRVARAREALLAEVGLTAEQGG